MCFFNFDMFNKPRADLSNTDPSNHTDNCTFGVFFAERILVAGAILNDDECGIITGNILEKRRYILRVDCFVRTYYVVELASGF